MKTRVELPDDLLRRTKAAAARNETSLSDFIAQSLEATLRAPLPAWQRPFGKARSLDTAPVKQELAELSKIDRCGW
jgi:hypothetical protein